MNVFILGGLLVFTDNGHVFYKTEIPDAGSDKWFFYIMARHKWFADEVKQKTALAIDGYRIRRLH